jgi:DNA-binding transcriptional ArsR family regulator
MDRMIHAIADPARREILDLLHHSEIASGDIAGHFQMTHSAISQHLKVLVDAGLVTVRKEGTRRIYSACPDGLAELRSVLLYLLASCSPQEPGLPPTGPESLLESLGFPE